MNTEKLKELELLIINKKSYDELKLKIKHIIKLYENDKLFAEENNNLENYEQDDRINTYIILIKSLNNINLLEKTEEIINYICKNINNYKDKIETLNSDLSSLNNKLQNDSLNINKINNLLEKTENENLELKNIIDNKEKDNCKIKDDYKKENLLLKDELKNLEDSINNKDSKIRNYSKTININENNKNDKITKLEEIIKNYKEDNYNLKNNINNLNNYVKDSCYNVEVLERNKNILEINLENKNEELEKLENLINSEREKYDNEIENQYNKNIKLKENFTKFKDIFNDLKSKMNQNNLKNELYSDEEEENIYKEDFYNGVKLIEKIDNSKDSSLSKSYLNCDFQNNDDFIISNKKIIKIISLKRISKNNSFNLNVDPNITDSIEDLDIINLEDLKNIMDLSILELKDELDNLKINKIILSKIQEFKYNIYKQLGIKYSDKIINTKYSQEININFNEKDNNEEIKTNLNVKNNNECKTDIVIKKMVQNSNLTFKNSEWCEEIKTLKEKNYLKKNKDKIFNNINIFTIKNIMENKQKYYINEIKDIKNKFVDKINLLNEKYNSLLTKYKKSKKIIDHLKNNNNK